MYFTLHYIIQLTQVTPVSLLPFSDWHSIQAAHSY